MKQIKLLAVFMLITVFLLPVTALQAAEEKSREPAYKPFHTIVEADFVKEIVDQKIPGILIDARPKLKKYDEGHIPGALSVPTTRFETMKGYLPTDKNALIVYYCEGVKCALSHKSAYKAEELGYTNVKVYAKGYPEWKALYGEGAQGLAAAPKAAVDPGKKKFKAGKAEGTMDQAVFEELLKNDPDAVLLVDVRDPHEFKKGAFKNSVNIPVDELEKRLATWKPEKPVVYVCGTGARSGEAYYMTLDKRPDMIEVYYVDGEIVWDQDGGHKMTPPK